MSFKEQLVEYPITDWKGASVRVVVELPSLKTSVTSMMVLDTNDMDCLKDLVPPEHIRLLEPAQASMEMIRWRPKQKNAMRVVDMLSNKIALHLAHTVTAALEKG